MTLREKLAKLDEMDIEELRSEFDATIEHMCQLDEEFQENRRKRKEEIDKLLAELENF